MELNAWGAELSRGFRLCRRVEHAEDVALLHDEQLLAIEFDLAARPLAEQHTVADLDVEGIDFAGLVAGTRANGDDLALLGLFLGGIGNNDPACCFASSSMRFTTTRSCRGRNFIEISLNYMTFSGFCAEWILAAVARKPAKPRSMYL